MVLPDMAFSPGSCSRVQQEDTGTAALEFEPGERQVRKRRRTRGSVLPTSTTSMPSGVRWRFAPARIRSITARPSRPARRLVRARADTRAAGGAFRGRDVGRIAHDDIVAPRSEAVKDVGCTDAHAATQAVPPDVSAGHLERAGEMSVASTRARGSASAGDRDAARAGADVEHALHARGSIQGAKPAMQLRERRARHQHVGVTRNAWPANQLLPVR